MKKIMVLLLLLVGSSSLEAMRGDGSVPTGSTEAMVSDHCWCDRCDNVPCSQRCGRLCGCGERGCEQCVQASCFCILDVCDLRGYWCEERVTLSGDASCEQANPARACDGYEVATCWLRFLCIGCSLPVAAVRCCCGCTRGPRE